MELTIDYELLKNQIDILYITNLIKVCEKNNIDRNELYKKIQELQKKTDETKFAIKKSKSNLNLVTSDSPVSSTPVPIQYNEDYLYQKPWTKLTSTHKIIKIREFVNQLLIDNENDKQSLKDTLTEMVKSKILTKKEAVNYDPVNSKVISITQLKYKSGKYLI